MTINSIINNSCIKRSSSISLVAIFLIIVLLPNKLIAQNDTLKNTSNFGVKIRVGGRFDDVRMCVASPAGSKGGPVADISFFMEFGVANNMVAHVDIPVFRPILFATSFKMLQFEPSVTFKYRKITNGNVDFVVGPTLGILLHYGPDYKSESKGDNRTDSFFAMGPILGGYFGLEFKRPNKANNFELGISPYVTPLFGINDPSNHKGVVIGGLLDFSFSFN